MLVICWSMVCHNIEKQHICVIYVIYGSSTTSKVSCIAKIINPSSSRQSTWLLAIHTRGHWVIEQVIESSDPGRHPDSG